jgi:hypothetical protein
MRWRKFLETPVSGTDSYVAVTVHDDGTWINLKIADCDRRINLGFDRVPKKRKAMIHKINTLQIALDKVRDALGPE